MCGGAPAAATGHDKAHMYIHTIPHTGHPAAATRGAATILNSAKQQSYTKPSLASNEADQDAAQPPVERGAQREAHIDVTAPVAELLEAHSECPILSHGVHREPARLLQGSAPQDHIGTGQRDEAEGVHAGLHHLPEVHVLVVEHVAIRDDVVHELRRERDTDVVAAVDVPEHRHEEAARARLIGIKQAHQLVHRDLLQLVRRLGVLLVGVDLLQAEVQVRGLSVQLLLRLVSARHVHHLRHPLTVRHVTSRRGRVGGAHTARHTPPQQTPAAALVDTVGRAQTACSPLRRTSNQEQ